MTSIFDDKTKEPDMPIPNTVIISITELKSWIDRLDGVLGNVTECNLPGVVRIIEEMTRKLPPGDEYRDYLGEE